MTLNEVIIEERIAARVNTRGTFAKQGGSLCCKQQAPETLMVAWLTLSPAGRVRQIERVQIVRAGFAGVEREQALKAPHPPMGLPEAA